jgi:ribosomal-protein-alanine N-acetyltransferase
MRESVIFEELSTERLMLKKLTPEIYQFVFDNFAEPDLMIFFGFDTWQELNKEKVKYDKGISSYNRSFLNFQLIDKQSKRIIGWCGFHTWYVEHNRAELGYMLREDETKGKGLMTEALKPIIEFGFNEMKLTRIEAFVGPDNEPSQRLLKHFGFVKEGQLREHYLKNNKMEDSIIFSLLRHEYFG